jgi:hypothetical protein
MNNSTARRVLCFAGGSLAILAASLGLGFLVHRFHLGGDPAGDGMLSGLVVLPMWFVAFGLAVVAFVLTIRGREKLRLVTRLFGILPAIAYVLTIIIALLS